MKPDRAHAQLIAKILARLNRLVWPGAHTVRDAADGLAAEGLANNPTLLPIAEELVKLDDAEEPHG